MRLFRWAKSVHVFVLVFLLPLTVARFADPNATFAHHVPAGAPHIDGIVDREGASAVGFVSEVVAAFDAAGNFAFLLGRL